MWIAEKKTDVGDFFGQCERSKYVPAQSPETGLSVSVRKHTQRWTVVNLSLLSSHYNLEENLTTFHLKLQEFLPHSSAHHLTAMN